jgi:flagellar biosynthesis/type III secretory pathway chaperone
MSVLQSTEHSPELVPPPAASPELVSALEYGHVLHAMLEKEFEALRVQDLDTFEGLQDEKLIIFEQLNQLTGVGTPANRLDDPAWDGFKGLIADCRDLHRRNEVLINRKLDAIRGTLQTLRGSDPTASVEVYDRLGRVSRMRGGRGYEEV